MLNDEYIINGKQYNIIRHGLARHNDFALFSQTSDELVFVQYENESTLQSFPYCYKLFISFKINNNKLTVTHTVENNNEETMYFSIGAHPAFNCKIGDTLSFEKIENKFCERIDENSILINEKDYILKNTDTITIASDTFNKDAMIFSSLDSKHITLNKQDKRKIKFWFYDAPFFAVWSKPNANFICLEPWYGINDSYQKYDDLSQKRGIITLQPHKNFSFSWDAEFLE